MSAYSDRTNEIVEVCLLAGKVMLESGGETYRVEDTMMRIAASFGIPRSHSYVTPTGIIFSIDKKNSTQFIRISERSTDLQKVALVNSISRRISNGELTLEEAYEQLKEVEAQKFAYPLWLQVIAAAIASGCFAVMLGGGWSNFLPSLLSGGTGFYCFEMIHRLIKIRFFAEFFASFVAGGMALLMMMAGLGEDLGKMMIGSVMPLVPGLAITNAVRDLMAGHLIAGLSRGAEAFLTAFAIGSGIALILSIR
ncbi:threonine/serine exporter family protein [Parageobacillus sp. VR-IP]|uniref:threonine/serine exporter family protein n=1 Tax=Parageobacillus sp. VR-IP TaxID=2742205 RepID=UPI0015836E40|nr:threonine/serine exporter family protein [Parageobacillus sp. VR-IP]NUK28843.1 threonine/serine exporter family protein [Parageobacillus sp. VR-IP]